MNTSATHNALTKDEKMSDFHTLNKIRKDRRTNFLVVSVTKSGALSKANVSDINRCSTREQAERRLACMEQLNPGKKFQIVEN